MIALAITTYSNVFARIVRVQVLTVAEQEYIEAAVSVGANKHMGNPKAHFAKLICSHYYTIYLSGGKHYYVRRFFKLHRYGYSSPQTGMGA